MEHHDTQIKNQASPFRKTEKVSYGAQICLRFFVIVATVAAMWAMLTSKQTTTVYDIIMDAQYSYCSAFKFSVIANGIACAITVMTLFFVIILRRRGSKPENFFLLFIIDLNMSVLVMAGTAASTAVGYVGKYGNAHTGWMAICDSFAKFCNKAIISIGLSYLSLFFLLILTIVSANKSRQIHV